MNIAVLGIRGIPASYGGFETCAEETTKIWVSQGHNVVVYCRRNHYKVRPKYLGAVKLVYIRSIPLYSLDTLSHTFFSVLHLIILNRKYRIAHLYNVGNGFIIPLLRLFRIKIAISVDGIEWERKKWGSLGKNIHKLGANIAVKFSNKVIADNPSIKDYYKEKFNCETQLIAYGCQSLTPDADSAAETLTKYNIRPKEYFLFVGRLVPEKKVLELIQSYQKLNTELPLVIIGDDVKHTDYRNKIFELQSDKIKILGFKYGDEYDLILANALIYVSASELEGTSPALLSALGAGVCALVNGIPENINTVEDSAYTFEANNLYSLVQIWQQLVDNENSIVEMGAKGFELATTKYSWDHIAELYLELFESWEI